VVAAPPGHERAVRELCGPEARVVAGGASRSESVAAALAAAGEGGAEPELIVVHDAARPLATPELFDEIVAALAADPGTDALIAAAPVVDTIKRCRGERLEVVETPPREELWAVQTPQAFRARTLRAALDRPPAELAAATDDASLVEARGGRVRVHPVEAPNPKLTTPADLRVIELLLRERSAAQKHEDQRQGEGDLSEAERRAQVGGAGQLGEHGAEHEGAEQSGDVDQGPAHSDGASAASREA
jgi:2-C-methyl-D-erythritol 4-phosphate cytidylyltransferase